MKLFVGLGNPGLKYGQTRHNVGWMVVDRLVDELALGAPQEKFKSYIWGPVLMDGERVFLMKPLTYMNASGEAIRDFLRYHPVDLEDLLVIYDDVALDVGRIRIRARGSAGGHNGMKSIIACLGFSEIPRLRIGVGPKPDRIPLVDFVLGRFPEDRIPDLLSSLDRACSACRELCSNSLEHVMNRFN
ncbi:peptidyl-tRNA hydrolase [Dethiosulfovibrio peptidovorans DSM 11002]|uniref:Peptidyl-tRNA hydrolase n=1 Tax=Dethiosulfovibrio peptidovorans DSM 11002 TaxID=469381 RepID=D2Z2T4_9BACT|nr:aminoacyl-tRNA hydrolase [Dethiosulfovibrio peptidovorans]EFC92097.1 peptidyl-tRNA hydrolase [Dethiosulfovibrio peptidovorans DSM 11002]